MTTRIDGQPREALRPAAVQARLASAAAGRPPQPNQLDYHSIVLLTDGASRNGSAKTAITLLRYRPEHIVAVLDRSESGLTAQQLFGVGGSIPVVGNLDEVPKADAMFIGIAPAGGRLPEAWMPLATDALSRGIDIVSGLHDFLSDNVQLSERARNSGSRLVDIRKNAERTVATHAAFPPHNLRIHTVGHDCSVGKMAVAMEVEKELKRRGHDVKFLATGQTGIMVSGDGIPVDSVVADFISGAVEQLVLRNQHHATLIVEGQGSLSHPSFSGVTLGLLHGCAPQGLILCYEAGRDSVKELPHVRTQPLAKLVDLYESVARLRHPSRVIGVAVNSRSLSSEQAAIEIKRVQHELNLPACDVYRDGAGVLADAVVQLRSVVAS